MKGEKTGMQNLLGVIFVVLGISFTLHKPDSVWLILLVAAGVLVALFGLFLIITRRNFMRSQVPKD